MGAHADLLRTDMASAACRHNAMGRGHPPYDDRMRGPALQRIREEHFRLNPLCVRCRAKTPPVYRLAVILDHIVALTNGGKDFDEDEGMNRQGLCAECHVEKTREDMGYRQDRALARRVGLDGWPVGGDEP